MSCRRAGSCLESRRKFSGLKVSSRYQPHRHKRSRRSPPVRSHNCCRFAARHAVHRDIDRPVHVPRSSSLHRTRTKDGAQPVRARSYRLNLFQSDPHGSSEATTNKTAPSAAKVHSCRAYRWHINTSQPAHDRFHALTHSRGFLKASMMSASGVPSATLWLYSHRAVSGSDIRIDSMRPPVFSPKTVPRS